ncbi:CoA ester lyase [Aminobacter sp. MSH1]|uniref:HpcH/HpaI aldolase/citrate lyase family protein n=1 Tax=Aminobacter sp. MSH1 TaxID=374606 RepID=UPI000D35FAD9|nr:CoA ester lyase [Aminobacter sp. MSH1]
MSKVLPPHRSYLFVPGDRADRFAKASGSDADEIILDLEDAVLPHAKADAREHVQRWLDQSGSGLVRINGADTPWFDDDVQMVSAFEKPVVLPKATQRALAALDDRLPENVGVVALVESVAGIKELDVIASHRRVLRLIFGSVDFASESGITAVAETAAVRADIVLSSIYRGLPPPIDGVSLAIRDEQALAADVAVSRAAGFGAKLALHPAQIAAINGGFSPSDDERSWAREVMDRAAATSFGAFVVQGKLVDRPVIDRASRILAQART